MLILGPTGTGKSWIACALGNQAARNGFSVRYRRLPRPLDELALARVDGHAARLLARLARIQLLILDHWAMARLTAEHIRSVAANAAQGRGVTLRSDCLSAPDRYYPGTTTR